MKPTGGGNIRVLIVVPHLLNFKLYKKRVCQVLMHSFLLCWRNFFSSLPSQMSFLPYCVIKNRVLIFKKGLQNHF